jgi:hypothetical protein
VFGFTQGEGGVTPQPAPLDNINFTGEFNGETKATIAGGQFNLSIKGKIHGAINNGDKTIVGTIEKGTIEGNIENDLIIRGKIVGIFKGSKDNNTVEQIIEGDFVSDDVFKEIGKKADNTKEVFVAVNIKTSLHGTIKNAILEENSHYSTFKMCKMYIEDAPESEYQLWPVIEDPDVS